MSPAERCECGSTRNHPIHDDPRAGLDIDEEPDPADQWPGAHPFGMASEVTSLTIEGVSVPEVHQQWFVFSAEQMFQLLRDLDVDILEAWYDVYNNANPDTAVIDHHQAFAGPTLHMVAQALAVSKSICFDVDQAEAIQAQADYFHQHAMEADDGRMELPGGE